MKLLNTAKAFLLCMLLLFAIPSYAAWPDKDVTFIVPFPPAGNTDAVARLIATNVSTSIGKQIIVDNRPGAGSMIGSQMVARAKPDGYTFLVGSSPREFARYINLELKKWELVIKPLNVSVD